MEDRDLTLIVALKGKVSKSGDEDAVVMTSDTQVTSYVKSPMRKIFQIEDLPILIGSSGSLSLSRYVIYGLNRLAQDFHKLKRNVSCEDFDEFANSKVESHLREVVRSHPDVVERDGLHLILSLARALWLLRSSIHGSEQLYRQ